jgi:hypothetical protein
VYEDIAAFIAFDESVSLGCIKPFDRTGLTLCHFFSFSSFPDIRQSAAVTW